MALFYAAGFAGVGVLMAFLPVHLRALGFSASATGALFAGRQLILSITPPVWGLWADRRGDARLPLVGASLLAALTFVPLLLVHDVALAAILLLIHAAGVGAIMPLADSMTLTILKTEPHRYGRVRLSGSISFGVGVLALALLAERGDPAEAMAHAGDWSVPALLASGVLGTLVALTLPRVPRARLEKGSRAFDALRAKALWVLFAAGALHWAAHAPYAVLFGVHVQDLHLGPAIAAWAIVAAVVVEVAVLFYASRFLAPGSAVAVLRLTFVVGVIRWVATAYVESAWLLIALQALHGVSFGLFYVVAIEAVRSAVPEELRSTGQSLYMAVVFGAGGVLGMLLAGYAYDAGGGKMMFLASAVLDAIAIVLTLRPSVWIPKAAES